MRKVLLILVILFSFGKLENSCPEFITCETSEKHDTCPDGKYYRTGIKVHGCCPGCVALKDKDQNCEIPEECRPGLTCSNNKKCEGDHLQACEHYKLFDPIWTKTKYWNPNCLPDGTYAPKQCKGEKMFGKCFCVDKMGNRIFGEEDWSKADNMTCACSRLVDEMKKIGPDVTLHCDSTGNFEPLQCDHKVCWCANPKTGLPYTIVVPLEMMVSLPCFSRNIEGIQYYRQCDSAKHMQEVAKKLLRNHGTEEVTLPTLQCNFDGSYNRVQIFGTKTRCVYINNSPLTEAVPSDNSNCNCAFDRHVSNLRKEEFLSNCHSNGNYVEKQTWNGKTYCVDADGFPFSNNPADCNP